MTLKELPVILKNLAEGSKEHETACGVIALRSEAAALYETEKYDDALNQLFLPYHPLLAEDP